MKFHPSASIGPLALLLATALVIIPGTPQAEAESKPAPSGHYVADPAHTSLIWRISHFGLSHYTARLTGISAELDWNQQQPTQSKLTVAIDPASVKKEFPFPDVEDFDKKIGTEADFLAGKPITFVSRSIEQTGNDVGLVKGDLTFRGETHPMTLTSATTARWPSTRWRRWPSSASPPQVS
ncbi:YceI family protein [Consotaella salsifontis]|uniref:Polyisoprenoid-binding protein YceI n=1 Tax=Consotaella salsifontis TaxID=1365950 RepID=A0A1T4PT96_9HYPH|nr:YceI family protein [Consotaella salsifontis]SJZ94742.1 Polyisoprenoid-binding protein YceI [Consotaella salsifontis]